MEEFPFTHEEWQEVQHASTSLTNAILTDDGVVQASLFAELLEVLAGLRRRHGEHPTLLETAADFCDDPISRRDMYVSAIRLAEANRLPTSTIRISLAKVLLQDFNDPTRAACELSACKPELASRGDESEMQEWCELVRKCRQKTTAAQPQNEAMPKANH